MSEMLLRTGGTTTMIATATEPIVLGAPVKEHSIDELLALSEMVNPSYESRVARAALAYGAPIVPLDYIVQRVNATFDEPLLTPVKVAGVLRKMLHARVAKRGGRV